jgi:hypothetical protein
MLDNKYYKEQLTPEQIVAGEHRDFVGGMWEELGELQFQWMQDQGLEPNHKLLDVGYSLENCPFSFLTTWFFETCFPGDV